MLRAASPMATIKIHVLNFHGVTSHIELLLENKSVQPSKYYGINRWADPSYDWEIGENFPLESASSSYSFVIEAHPNKIIQEWVKYYYETKNDASIFGENCAVAVQRFLTHFANIPEPRSDNLSWNHLAFGIMWPNFIPCPVLLPGRVMDNVKQHTENLLTLPTSIADLPENCGNEYANAAIAYLKQLNPTNKLSGLSKKSLIKFNNLNNFYCCLSDVKETANKLRINGHARAAATIDQLVNNLQASALAYLKNPENTAFETFKSQCFNQIKESFFNEFNTRHFGNWGHLSSGGCHQ
jgi:hypothetical protein